MEFWKRSSISTQVVWAHFADRVFSVAQFGWTASSAKCLVVPNFIHLLATLSAAKILWSFSSAPCLGAFLAVAFFFLICLICVELKASTPCGKFKMIVVRTRTKEDRNDGKPPNSLLVSLVALRYSSPVLGRPRHYTVCSPLFLLPRGAGSTEINVQKQLN